VYSGKRRLIDFETMPLDYIKTLKTAHNVTLNDILFAALGGAIRRYNVAHGCEVTEKRKKRVLCRALMPVAFPRPKAETTDKTAVLRNKWVFVSADFGVGIEEPAERLKHVNKGMGEIKNSPYAPVQLYVQESIPPKLPLAFGRKTVFDMISRHSVIFSNVPGPEKAVAFGGQKVVGIQMYFNNLIPQVGILSYEGKVFMNMNMDTDAIPGSEKMPTYFAQELVAMSKAHGIEVPLAIVRRSEM
jgi:diacylglycerol O-acyltransferase